MASQSSKTSATLPAILHLNLGLHLSSVRPSGISALLPLAHLFRFRFTAPTRSLDKTALLALLCSTSIIFTTIHAQDFADVEGDKASGRRTLPIVAPEGSRVWMLVALMLWSCVLAGLWGLGPVSGTLYFCTGSLVGARYFKLRKIDDDKRSYLLYNVSLGVLGFLPQVNLSPF